MRRVIVAPQAELDLLEIVARLASVAGPATADKWDRKLWKAIDNLVEFPGIGAPRPVLGDHIRITTVHPYVVIHEHALGSDTVQILRVVHGRRNITKDLLRP